MISKKEIKNLWQELNNFFCFVIRHFFEDDGPYRASALAFTSLLAVVPLMTVVFAILSAFPVFNQLMLPVQDFIFENFVPATGKIVQVYLLQFEAQVSKLSVWGVVFLFITAILLMVTIEGAMNKIWRTSQAREGVTAFLLYWAILSLAPFFLGLSIAASSYLLSMPFLSGYNAPSSLINTLPFFLSMIGFTFLYVVVPNCPVKIRHGFIGGLVAAILFEAAKQAFAFYLSKYNSYQLLYGAFATVPVFFVWVYWVWLVALLGAEVSYALSVHHERRTGTPLDGFSQALLWLEYLWFKQKSGDSVPVAELHQLGHQRFAVDTSSMLNLLQKLSLIETTGQGKIILSRPLDDLSLYWLSQNLPFRLPAKCPGRTTNMPCPLEKTAGLLKENLDVSLTELFQRNLQNASDSSKKKKSEAKK